MKKTRLTLSFARLLQALPGGELNYAEFNGGSRKLLDQFVKDGVLEYRMIGKQQRKIVCRDPGNLEQYLHHKFGIPSLADYVVFLNREEVQRSDAVRAASDSKLRKTRVFMGFFVNAYEEVAAELNGQPFLVKRGQGFHTFITGYPTFRIPPGVTVVVVENYENFREIERQRYLFTAVNPLFVWRYQNSNAIVEWLNTLPNAWLHFGDFDPKGIHIYLSEFKRKITGDRGQFLIPGDLETLLSTYGEKDLFEKQQKLVPLLEAERSGALEFLIDLILRYRKGLAQEILIR